MVLIETMVQAWTQYRNGLVYAVQQKNLDAAIVFIRGMWAMLPEKDRDWTDADGNTRNTLPSVPTATDLKGSVGSSLINNKWGWVTKSVVLIEERISDWVHHNIDASVHR